MLGEDNPQAVNQLINCINQFDPFDCKPWFENNNMRVIIQIFWRNRVVDYIKEHKAEFYQFVIGESCVAHIPNNEQKFESYLQKMRDAGMWAGDIERLAASQIVGYPIHFITRSNFNSIAPPKLTLVCVNAAGEIHGPLNHYHFKLSAEDFFKIAKQDRIPIEDDKLPPDLDFDRLSISNFTALPSYVLNIPVVISSDSDEISDEEADDATIQFPDVAFDNPKNFIRLMPKEEKLEKKNKPKKNYQRGQIDYAHIGPIESKFFNNGKSEKVLAKLSSSAFIRKESRDDYTRLRVVLGLNKMRSLSSARNKALGKSLNGVSYSSLINKRFGFFWDGVWQRKSLNGWEIITYKEAREFYKRLKKRNKKNAQTYRAEIEKSRGHMVPYREIRDAIKNHTLTKDSVREGRNYNGNPAVYLVFFDGDVVSANGAFSVYDKLCSNSSKALPVVLSGGYLVVEKTNPLMELGVRLDLAVRHETTQIIRGGAYYPEPNTLTLVELGKDTVEENFSTGTLVYESPKEMPILMKKIIMTRKLNAQNDFIFNQRAAILTTCPARMVREFSAVKNSKGKIISWRLEDFKKMRGINQSHLKPRSWAKYIVDWIQLPNGITIVISGNTIALSDQKIIKDMLVSLISRIFKAFDPVFMANSAHKRKPESSFRKELVNILQQYEKIKKELFPASRLYNRTSKSTKPQTPASKLKKESAVHIWRLIDNITDVQECQMVIDQLLCSPKINSISAANILLAAKQSQLAVINILRESLSTDFTEIFLGSLIAIHNDYSTDSSLESQGDTSSRTLHPAYALLLSVECLDNKATLLSHFRAMKEKVKSIFGTLPLHFAAIKGDVALVKFLLDKKSQSKLGWIGDINKTSDYDLLPVHCAIRYCAEHEENYEIIKLLTDEHNINAEIASDDHGFLTSFTMAIVELKNPLPLLAYFVETFGDKILISTDEINFDKTFVNAILEKFFDLADFVSGNVSNVETVLSEAIENMSPYVDKNLIERALDAGVDLDEIKNEMGDYELMDFESNLRSAMGWHTDEEDFSEEVNRDSCDEQNQPEEFFEFKSTP